MFMRGTVFYPHPLPYPPCLCTLMVLSSSKKLHPSFLSHFGVQSFRVSEAESFRVSELPSDLQTFRFFSLQSKKYSRVGHVLIVSNLKFKRKIIAKLKVRLKINFRPIQIIIYSNITVNFYFWIFFYFLRIIKKISF